MAVEVLQLPGQRSRIFESLFNSVTQSPATGNSRAKLQLAAETVSFLSTKSWFLPIFAPKKLNRYICICCTEQKTFEWMLSLKHYWVAKRTSCMWLDKMPLTSSLAFNYSINFTRFKRVYHVSQKTAPFCCCNNFVKPRSILIFLAVNFLSQAWSRKQRTSLSFTSIARQHSVCTQPSSCFVARRQTSSYHQTCG